jgi:DNA-binding NtrC family response regulator
MAIELNPDDGEAWQARGWAHFQLGHWDLAVADYTMPSFSGTQALAIVREHGVDLPFIFVSGTIGEDVAVAAMKQGAHDYIIKGHLARLAPAVQRELRDVAVRRERTRCGRGY